MSTVLGDQDRSQKTKPADADFPCLDFPSAVRARQMSHLDWGRNFPCW
ncbi:hypothetical protein [Microseira wollei]|nr:hypothetical protein [Microseira wollei]